MTGTTGSRWGMSSEVDRPRALVSCQDSKLASVTRPSPSNGRLRFQRLGEPVTQIEPVMTVCALRREAQSAVLPE